MLDNIASTELLYQFGLALLIGALIGLQREYAHGASSDLFAGVRTYAIIGVIGCAAGLAAITLQAPEIFAAMALVIGGLLIAAYVLSQGRDGPGLTSEMAVLITFLCGGMVAWGYGTVATAIGVAIAILLALKARLHGLARQLSPQDMQASLTLAGISLIVLPVLPNTPIGPAPLDVINPQKIWLLVVLISTLSFSGYILHKIIGTTRGIALTGLIGGIVSSTAVTLSNTQRSRITPELSQEYALAILLSWAVMFVRVGLLTSAIAPEVLQMLWPVLLAGGSGCLIWGRWLARRSRQHEGIPLNFGNPLELRSAIGFSLLYTTILVGANFARTQFGEAGLFITSIFGGLVDVDAITLSLSELAVTPGGLSSQLAASAIGVAVLTNTLVKGGIALAGGSSQLRRSITPALLLITGSILVTLFWPW
jgi:uncharacterized membrane protein (DUF4010 family)